MLDFRRVFPLVLSAVVAILATGCSVGPAYSMTDDSVEATNTAGNVLRMTDAAWTAATQTSEPTGIAVDAEGFNQVGAGPHMTTGLVANDASLFSTSPTGFTIESAIIEFGDDGEVQSVTVRGLASDPAVAIAAYNERAIAGFEAQGIITAENAATMRAAIDAGKTLAEAAAEVGLRIVTGGVAP